MFEINRNYGEVLAKLLSGVSTSATDQQLIQRLERYGIRLGADRVTALNGTDLADPLVTSSVRRFVEGTYLADRMKPSLWIVRREIEDLCDWIAARRRQAGVEGAVVSVHAPTAPVASSGLPKSINVIPQTPIDAQGNLTVVPLPGQTPAVAQDGAQSAPVGTAASQTSNEPPSGISKSAPAPPELPPVRKPATWQENEATGPWCPENIQKHLGFEVDYKDNYQSEAAASPGWHIIAATHRGRMHAHHGTHREDAFLYHCEKDFTIVCVSDGAGSYQHSRIGSESTCRHVVNALKAVLSSRSAELAKLTPAEFNVEIQTAIGEAVKGACDFLHDLATKTETKSKDFRCTLVLGVLWLAGETPLLVFSQVGDGFIAGQSKDGQAQRYGESDSGAFSGEVNCFMPDADAVRNAQHVIAINAANADAFILCSDGIEDPFYPTEKKSQVIFQQLREGVSEPLAGFEKQKPHGPVIGATDAKALLATWLDFEKKGENDDRTILILHRSPSQLTDVVEIKSEAIATAASSPEPKVAAEPPIAAKSE